MLLLSTDRFKSFVGNCLMLGHFPTFLTPMGQILPYFTTSLCTLVVLFSYNRFLYWLVHPIFPLYELYSFLFRQHFYLMGKICFSAENNFAVVAFVIYGADWCLSLSFSFWLAKDSKGKGRELSWM